MLSGIGVYSAIAYSVGRRLRELGIRVALGAQRDDIVQTVLGRLAVAVAVGVAGGLGATAMLAQLIRNFLFQIDPLDGSSCTLAAAILVFSSLMAAVIPTRRALRIEPAAAFRQN